MKIGTDNSDGRTGGLDPLNGVARQQAPATRPAQVPEGDHLTLSSAARVLQAAQESVDTGVPIRQDVVDRLRALLADGQLGGDAASLADAIIDNWIETSGSAVE